jgi:hypothetical protein
MVHGLDRSPSWMSRNVEGDVLSKWLIPIRVVGIRGNYLQYLYSCGQRYSHGLIHLIENGNEIYCINYRENVVQCLLTRSLRRPGSSLFAILRDALYLLARVARCASAVDPGYARIPLWHRHS